ncbi:hypothetical protein ACFSL6_10750 [Paenibacillus thailandensis]|uniref:Uncharacterized protein n=1 Tax=Paenibacillus thailandensis TaxID=393250 RepID=A0ABW5R3A9_9BACL
MTYIDVDLGELLAITLTIAAVWLLEWRGIKDGKTRAVFAFLLITLWVLGMLISLIPDLPGPPQLIKAMIEPFMRTEI